MPVAASVPWGLLGIVAVVHGSVRPYSISITARPLWICSIPIAWVLEDLPMQDSSRLTGLFTRGMEKKKVQHPYSSHEKKGKFNTSQ
jgi:hypothetical protein